MRITFTSAVSNLMFQVFGAQNGDSVFITAFNGASTLGSATFTTNSTVDFSGFGTISSLFFDDSSTAAGMGYGNFTFDAAITQVPLPASLPMLVAGLAGLGFLRRRKAA